MRSCRLIQRREAKFTVIHVAVYIILLNTHKDYQTNKDKDVHHIS